MKGIFNKNFCLQVQDLLNPSNTLDSLPVRWSTENGFYVDNLFSAECDNADDLLEILQEGYFLIYFKRATLLYFQKYQMTLLRISLFQFVGNK